MVLLRSVRCCRRHTGAEFTDEVEQHGCAILAARHLARVDRKGALGGVGAFEVKPLPKGLRELCKHGGKDLCLALLARALSLPGGGACHLPLS